METTVNRSPQIRRAPRRAPLCALLWACAAACGPAGDADAGSPFADDLAPKDAGPIVRPDAGIDPHLLPCVEDALEPNDESGAAAAIPASQDVDAALCSGDDDWYAIAADAGCSIDARISFDPSYGDLDLHLFAPDGTLLAAGATAGEREVVQANAEGPGTYLVRVTGPSTSKTVYALRVEVVCAETLSCPADDPYEPNDDAATAAQLDAADQAAGIVCAADADLYAIPSTPGCVLDAKLTFVDADGDLDLEMLIGDRVLAASRGTDDDERVLKAVPDGTPPVFRVYGFQDQENVYRFEVDEICPSEMACPTDDPFEPNDDGPSAVSLDPPDGASGVVCGLDEDWYEVSPTTGCTLTLDLRFSHAAGDLDLKLLRTNGTQVGSSASTDDDERIDYVVETAGTLRARVHGYAGAENRYRLLVSEACP